MIDSAKYSTSPSTMMPAPLQTNGIMLGLILMVPFAGVDDKGVPHMVSGTWHFKGAESNVTNST
jgi:hypothetical protein